MSGNMNLARASGGLLESQGHVVRDLNATLIAITTIVVILRLYVRGFLVQALGFDDLIASVAFVLTIAVSSIEIVQVGNGSGMSMDQLSKDQIVAFFSMLPVGQLIYFWACGFVRLSVLAFLPRLNKDRVYMRFIWGVGFFIVAITLIAFFFFLTECRPIGDLFNAGKPDRKCISKDIEAQVLYAHAGICICIDLALFGLPIWVIRTRMTFGSKAVKVILVFCVGLFTVVTGIVRLGFIVTSDFSVNTTYKIKASLWTMIELHVGLWCGCFPALQPLLRQISYNLGLRSRLESSNKRTPHTATMPDTNRERSWTTTSGYIRQGSAIDHDSDAASGQAILSSGDSVTRFIELSDLDKGMIRKKTQVQITVQDGTRMGERNEVKTTWDGRLAPS